MGEHAGVAETREPCVVRVPCADTRPGGIGIFLRVGLSRTAAALEFWQTSRQNFFLRGIKFRAHCADQKIGAIFAQLQFISTQMPDDFDQPLGKHGGARAGAGRPKKGESRERKNQSYNVSGDVTLNSRGNSRRYIVARLRRDNRDDLIAAIRNGETSAFACAVLLGWRRRPDGDHNQARRPRFDPAALIG